MPSQSSEKQKKSGAMKPSEGDKPGKGKSVANNQKGADVESDSSIKSSRASSKVREDTSSAKVAITPRSSELSAPEKQYTGPPSPETRVARLVQILKDVAEENAKLRMRHATLRAGTEQEAQECLKQMRSNIFDDIPHAVRPMFHDSLPQRAGRQNKEASYSRGTQFDILWSGK